jgi:integrase
MYKTPKIRTKGHGVSGKQVSRYIFVHTFKPYLDMWLAEREKKGIDSPYLFVVKRFGEYKPADIGSFNSWALRIGELIGVDFYGHCVRHAWTTNLSKSGYPKEIIQKLQNWSTMDLVDVYDDTDFEDQLEEFFSKRREMEVVDGKN